MALGSKGGPNTSKLLSHCAPPRMTAWFGSTWRIDRKSTRLNSSHLVISYAVFCFKKNRSRRGGWLRLQHFLDRLHQPASCLDRRKGQQPSAPPHHRATVPSLLLRRIHRPDIAPHLPPQPNHRPP